MTTRQVKLKNLDGDYLYPYTDNIPTASTTTAGKVKLDSAPVSGSSNALTSGAAHTALAGKLNTSGIAAKATADASGNNIVNTYATKKVNVVSLAVSGTISLTDNTIHRIAPTGTVTFTLPSVSDNTIFHQILVQMNLASKQTINFGTSNYFAKTAPDLAAGRYEVFYEYNGSHWVVGVIPTGVAE